MLHHLWTPATRRRWSAWLLVSVLLAACGTAPGTPGNQAQSSPAASPASQAAASPSPAGAQASASPAPAGETTTPAGSGHLRRLETPVTLEIFTPVQSVELPPPGDDWLIAKIVKEQLNIDLKMSWQTDLSEYERLVMTRGAANDLPDLFLSSNNLARDLGAQGLLGDWQPLLPLMPTYVRDREVESLAPIGTFDGKLYALVTRTSSPFKQAVIIREDWLQKLGLQVPKTLDEYMEVMRAFTTRDPDGNGQADTWGFTSSVDSIGQFQNLDPFFGAFGALGDWRIDNNQLVYVPTSPERKAALEFLNRMHREGVIDPDWASQKGSDRGNKYRSGRIGLFQEDWCAAFCRGNYDPFAEANPTGRWLDIAPPIGPDGKSAISTYSRVGMRFSMSQRAIDQGKGEAIARFMEWLNTDGYYLTAFGEEGKHWRREGNKIVAEQTDEARILRALAGWAYKGSEEELRARYDQTTTHKNGQVVDVWAIMTRAQAFPKVDVTDFAALPPAPPGQAADIQRLKAEGELQFATGQRPFSEWDAYVAALESAGVAEWRAQAEQRAREIGLLK